MTNAALRTAPAATRPAVGPLHSTLPPVVIATIHPSAVLRASGGTPRTEAMAGLVADLDVAASILAGRVI